MRTRFINGKEYVSLDTLTMVLRVDWRRKINASGVYDYLVNVIGLTPIERGGKHWFKVGSVARARGHQGFKEGVCDSCGLRKAPDRKKYYYPNHDYEDEIEWPIGNGDDIDRNDECLDKDEISYINESINYAIDKFINRFK